MDKEHEEGVAEANTDASRVGALFGPAIQHGHGGQGRCEAAHPSEVRPVRSIIDSDKMCGRNRFWIEVMGPLNLLEMKVWDELSGISLASNGH